MESMTAARDLLCPGRAAEIRRVKARFRGDTLVALRQGVQDLHACGNDFGANPVARDGCDGIRLH
jgi:hypothetical protein